MGYFHVEVGSPHYGMEIAAGQAPRVKPINLFGYKSALGIDWATVYSNQHPTFVIPEVMEHNTYYNTLYQFQSNDTADNGLQLLVEGLDSNFDEKFYIHELGLGSTQRWSRINKMTLLNGSNAGHIVARPSGAGGTQYLVMNPGDGITQSLHYTVPRGYNFYIFRINATSGTVNSNKYITFRNHIENPLVTPTRVINTATSTMQNGESSFDRQIPFKISELTDFSFQAKSSAQENEFSMFVEGILMKDED